MNGIKTSTADSPKSRHRPKDRESTCHTRSLQRAVRHQIVARNESMPITDLRVQSECLGESRNITLFLPSPFESGIGFPIVFCADGQAMRTFVQRMERESSGKPLDVAFIGVHSSAKRSQEYTVNQDASNFRLHERFFAEELPDFLRARFGLVLERSQTGIFGFSHGGAFALTMAARHRHLFGVVMAFSIAGEFQNIDWSDNGDAPTPKFYLSAGTREKPLLKATRRLAKDLRRHKVEHVVTERHAGHDYEYWTSEFPLAIKWAFANGNDDNPTKQRANE